MHITKRWWRFINYLGQRLIQDDCNFRAAQLTFTSLLAIVPLMSVSLTIVAAFPMFKSFSGNVEQLIFSHFIVGSGNVIQKYLSGFMQQAAKLSVTGLVVLIITALLMMRTMEGAFNVIWKVRRRRRGISAFLLYWSILTLAPILIGLSLALSSYLFSLPFISHTAHRLGVETLLLRLSPFVLSVIAFTLLYVAIPNCRVPIRPSLIGALVAAILFEIAKRGFTFYITQFPSYKIIYGALASIPLFFIWVYLTWIIVLIGAIISNALTVRYQFQYDIELDEFCQAYRWLGYFWQAQKKGKTLSLWDLLKKDNAQYHVEPEKQLALLIDNHLIHHVGRDRYILSRDLSTFTVRDLYHVLPWKLPQTENLKLSKLTWDINLLELLENFDKTCQQDLTVPLSQLYQ